MVVMDDESEPPSRRLPRLQRAKKTAAIRKPAATHLLHLLTTICVVSLASRIVQGSGVAVVSDFWQNEVNSFDGHGEERTSQIYHTVADFATFHLK